MHRTIEETEEAAFAPAIESAQHAGDFNALVLEALDETLRHLFNDAAVGAIYFYLEQLCCLPRDAVAANPEAFSTGLEKLMGQGAIIIEKETLTVLHHKLALELAEEEGNKFEDGINELKAKFGRPRKTAPSNSQL